MLNLLHSCSFRIWTNTILRLKVKCFSNSLSFFFSVEDLVIFLINVDDHPHNMIHYIDGLSTQHLGSTLYDYSSDKNIYILSNVHSTTLALFIGRYRYKTVLQI